MPVGFGRTMLCPECGTNVGDTPSLCEKCQAARNQIIAEATAESDSGSSAIGSIRPNLKIVRLNRNADRTGVTPGDASGDGSQSQDSTLDPLDQPSGGSIPRGILVAFAVLMLLSCLGLGTYLLRDQLRALIAKVPNLSNQGADQSQFKDAIQIRVRPDPADLNSRSKFGYAIAGYTGYAFRKAVAKYSKKTSILSLDLYSEFARSGEPEMRVTFTFSPNQQELILDKLLNFQAALRDGESIITFNRLYSPKAIGLDIVPRLHGTLGTQPTLKLLFNGNEFKTESGGGTDYSWKISLNIPIEITP
jgi:hypothetical protein